jgi:hypothetical protein
MIYQVMGVQTLSCGAPTAELAGRAADALCIMLGLDSRERNFVREEYPQDLLPWIPRELADTNTGGDARHLVVLRESLLRPTALTAAFLACASCSGTEFPLSLEEHAALLEHLRRMCAELAAAVNAAVATGPALAEYNAWLEAQGGASRGPALPADPAAVAQPPPKRPREGAAAPCGGGEGAGGGVPEASPPPQLRESSEQVRSVVEGAGAAGRVAAQRAMAMLAAAPRGQGRARKWRDSRAT